MAESEKPPENPFELDNGAVNPPPYEPADEAMQESTPSVASRASKAYVVLGLVAAAVLFLLYNIFFSGDSKKETKGPKEITVAPKGTEPPPLPMFEPTTAPLPPTDILAPSLPEPIDITPAVDPRADAAEKERLRARMRSNIMIKDGANSLTSPFSETEDPQAMLDANARFARDAAATQVETVAATRMKGQLFRTIGQGRIIQATMESALNTDLSAPIRAIVSRDTYGEAGNIPLIPKGSRLIGSYNTTITSGQARVLVIWTRVIRPDGVDVMLGSPLVDGIGRAGVGGQIDSKFQEIFSRALLASVMNIAVAIGSDEITGGTTTTTTSTDGGSQTTGDAATTATTDALDRLGAVTEGFIARFINVAPTIMVDQGTIVNVFVNKDIVFPNDTATGAHIVD